MQDSVWSTNLRAGVVAILNNRVGPADKLQALLLAERIISIVGEEWLMEPVELPDARDPIPASRCIQLVFGTSKVEIAVLLNEMAYFRDEASKSSTLSAETITIKCRNLGIMFSLVEKVIKIVSKIGEGEESHPDAVISDSTLMNIISGLNETINVVLEYLKDAKEHGQNKGDDLLASVQIVGRYLAETPDACREKVKELLSYMLSVQGEDEHCPFPSTFFLLPMLCQITVRTDGCELCTSTDGLRAVIEYLVNLIAAPSSDMASDDDDDDDDAIFLACDTVLNFLLNGGHLRSTEVDACLFKLLRALSRWTEKTSDLGIVMMASSICALILDSTSEKALLRHPELSGDDLNRVAQLMKKKVWWVIIQPPWDTEIGKAFIIHYTYGCNYDLQGKLTYGKIGEWRFDKRSYDNTWPPRNLSLPPPGVSDSVVTLVKMVNEATANIPNWGSCVVIIRMRMEEAPC